MIEYNKWIKQKYYWMKENIQFVILIPTLIGGIWQLIELSRISISFIRFFSVTQLISDGLLVLFILIVFYLFYQVTLIGSNKDYENEKNEDSQSKIKLFSNGLILIVISIFAFLWLCIPPLKEFYFNNKVDLFLIAMSISIAIILIRAFYVGFLRVIKSFKINSNYAIKTFESKTFEKVIIPFLSPLILVIFIFILSISIKVILNFRNSYYLPKKLHNIENIQCYFKNKFNIEEEKWEILYFNDQYIFTEFQVKNDTNYLILDFDILLDSEVCR